MTTQLSVNSRFDLVNIPQDALEIRRIAREFTRNELEPVEAMMDSLSQPADAFELPEFKEVMRRAGELGLTRAGLPADLGGLGLGIFAQMVLVEELAAGAPGLGSHILAGGVAANILLATSNWREHDLYVKYVGSRTDPSTACRGGAWAATEPDLGADILSLSDPGITYGTTAVAVDGGYTINGQKSSFVSNSYCADAYIVMATVEPGRGMEGAGVFFVPADAPGVVVAPPVDKLGLRALNQAPVLFDGVKVPAEAMLIGPGPGFLKFVTTLTSRGNVAVGLQAIGLAQRSFELALEYARKREQGGRPLAEHQLIAEKLITAYREIMAARALCYEAVRLVEARQGDQMMCFASRVQAVRMAIQTVEQMVQVVGSVGVVRGNPLERYYRDVKLLAFADGPIEKVSMLAASMLP